MGPRAGVWLRSPALTVGKAENLPGFWRLETREAAAGRRCVSTDPLLGPSRSFSGWG